MKRGRGGGRRAAGGARNGSRERLLKAAAVEFAARGFAGANVDRIARTAGVNKAMIYYHFKGKAALYQEILRDMFQAVAAGVRTVVSSDASPEDQVCGIVQAIAVEAEARPHFPPIWFREIAEGGAHLDMETMRHIAGIVERLVTVLQRGVSLGRFRPVNPLLVHSGIVGPLLLYFASSGVRRRLERAGLGGASRVTREEVVGHVQRVTLALVQGTTP